MARQKARVKDIASQVVKRKTPKRHAAEARTGRKDVKTPMRKDVILRAAEITHGGRLTRAKFQQLSEEFPMLNLKENFVRKQLKWYRDETSQGRTVTTMEWGRKRKECGRGVQKFTVAIAQKLIEINNKHWGRLSFKRLASKLIEEGINVSPQTVNTWCKELQMQRRRRYIKPKLTLVHKIKRLKFVLSNIDRKTAKFTDLKNIAHGDEKWFYLMKDCQVCRVFPDKQGQYQVPAAPRVYHKSRMPKVMVLAVCARPRPEYGFDGKVGLWSFTLERTARRSNIRTGTVVGETLILEDVRVDGTTYRQKIVGKDGVFQQMREKMWWFHKDARYVTVDGTRQPCGKRVSASGVLRNAAARSALRLARHCSTSMMVHGRTLLKSTNELSTHSGKRVVFRLTLSCSLLKAPT